MSGLEANNSEGVAKKQKIDTEGADQEKELARAFMRKWMAYSLSEKDETFPTTKVTDKKFDLLTLANRKFVREAVEGVYNVNCLLNSDYNKEKGVEVNGIRHRVTHEAIEHWARFVATFSYKLLRMADAESWGPKIDMDHIEIAFQKLTAKGAIPVLLSRDVKDPVFTAE